MIVTQAEFARAKGWNKSRVTRLKQEGRIILTEDGRVDVEATEKRLAETSIAGQTAETLTEARARKERALADLAELDARQKRGELIPRETVIAALREAAIIIRASFEALPDQFAPVLAPVTALDEVHALLSEAIRAKLFDAAETLKRIEDGLAR